LVEFIRVQLDFVSAYAVVRGSEAAVVDTGVGGSEGAIEAALGNVNLDWSAVGHVILTHHHGDHVGSLSAVMDAAPQATGYIGQGDIDNVSGPRQLMPVVEGEEIFGLQVIETPGHTAGHICLLDSEASVFIAGDALTGVGGGVDGPNPQFSENHDQALASVAKIAGLTFETLYFGHGDPLMAGASSQVADLAASL
jgi:glyoxylase-like metal-dependent hydrolase (beta-lactamase superfamily II)